MMTIRMKKILLSAFLATAALSAFGRDAFAWDVNGTVVCDSTGAALAAASVDVQGNTSAGAFSGSVFTGSAGTFFLALPDQPGTFDAIVDLSAAGGGSVVSPGSDVQFDTSVSNSVTINWRVNSPSCPPPGKTLEIGPSSMEGHLLIQPGDWINGGYSFVFVNGNHAATTVTVTSTMTLPFRCADGTTGKFVINLGTHNYAVPANNTSWQPTGDANSVLSWAGSGQAPAGCGPGNIMDNSRGAIFEAMVSQDPETGSMLNWRFKYRDPNAKGKGNVNCLDTSDPRRDRADVCGASWSGTVRDP